MAKDIKKIVRGIRIDDRVYKTGEEDELQKVLKGNQAQRFVDNGSLEGDWGGTGKAEEASAEPESESVEPMGAPTEATPELQSERDVQAETRQKKGR